MFDSDKAASATTRMWVRLGKLLERAAYARAERESGDDAVRLARLADCCFWQATGESDTQSFEKVLGS